MPANAEVDLINKELKVHGTNKYGEPIFHVVFSDEQLENRKGVFRDYHSKIILVREIEEVREVRKYPWIDSKWILERWIPGDIGKHRDLVTEKDGIHVCVYVFQDADQNYLPPLLKVAQIVVNNLLNPRSKSEALSQDAIIESKTEEVEVDKIENELKIHSDLIASHDPNASRETMSVGYVKDKI